MKIALVGCGGISSCHFAAIEKLKDKGVSLAAVCDIIEERAEKCAQKYGCKAYTDYDEMLEKESIDVVHICTPHYIHADMAAKALQKNINVVLEKPCAVSEESLLKLQNAQKNSSAQIAVCFQNRYNPSVKFIKSLLDGGEYGNVLSARALVTWRRDKEYYDADPWRGTLKEECGGVLINQAIHTHDLFKYLSGKTTRSVDAKVSNFHLKDDIEVEDTASVYFTFDDGTRGVYFATNAAGIGMEPLADINCEKATLRVEGGNVFEISGGKIKLLFSDSDPSNNVGKREWGDSHSRLIEDFYEHIKSGEHFPIDSVEAGLVIKDLLAIYESSKLGKTVFLK